MCRTCVRDRVSPLKTTDKKLIHNSKHIDEALNEYFLSIFTQEIQTLIPEVDQVFLGKKTNKLRDIIVTSKTICQEIERLEEKSPGPD